ncbi:MAG: hypothetical protein JW973_17780 [Bacteroidales bacterium]|nr:hypothetical protein [Bacteroidales bacterium]
MKYLVAELRGNSLSIDVFKPNDTGDFLQRMSALSTNLTPAFLSTHPSDEKRIAQIRKYLPEAMKYYQQGSTVKSSTKEGKTQKDKLTW